MRVCVSSKSVQCNELEISHEDKGNNMCSYIYSLLKPLKEVSMECSLRTSLSEVSAARELRKERAARRAQNFVSIHTQSCAGEVSLPNWFFSHTEKWPIAKAAE